MTNGRLTKLGPFPPGLIDRVTARLKEQGIPFSVYSDPELIEAYRQKRMEREPSRYHTFEGEDVVFVEVPFEAVMVIRPELEKLGVSLTESDFDPGFDRPEYLCPICEHRSDDHGLCPKHRVPLVEFSELAERRRRGSSHAWFWVLLVLVLIGAVLFLTS